MMDCIEYRRSILADPHGRNPDMRSHRESCVECAQFTEQLLRFENRLERAVRIDIPSLRADRPPPPRDRSPRFAPPTFARPARWQAIAASVLLAALVAGALWLSVPDRSLAAQVVNHMAGEPQAWLRTDTPVPPTELKGVLRDSHLWLEQRAGIVSYAQSCLFRGYRVPHLVVQTESGPVTVMVLVHESAAKYVQFDEGGYRGVILPVAGHGSLAVLTRGRTLDSKSVDLIATRVLDAIVWTS
jgi:hypothetical protein